MSVRRIINGVCTIGLMLGLAAQAQACGGGYGYCEGTGRDRELLASPGGYFLAELRRVLPRVNVPFKAQPGNRWEPKTKLTLDGGALDLQMALKDAGMTYDQSQPIINDYRAARSAVTDHPLTADATVKGLPREFALYLKGAQAWRAHDAATAKRYWLAVLMLPADQRKYRTVWATYMLARSCVGQDDAMVIEGMKLVRQLAGEGFADSTGLAAASIGWQAQATYKTNRPAGIALYIQQLATGDDSAAPSLRMCAANIMAAGDEVLDWAATHELPRGLITAHLVAGYSSLWSASSNTGKPQVERWLAVVERANVHDVAGAGRLAWAAYRTDLMDQARRWADRAADDDVIACWIKAKLLMRAGQLDAAAKQLAIALRPPMPVSSEQDELNIVHAYQIQQHNNRIADDLAALKLNRQQYIDAMDLLVRYDHLCVANYIAERVLDTNELKAYVDAHAGSPLSELLAGRLVREGRWKEGRAYFSYENAQMLDHYIAAIRRGNDAKLSRAERADAFWQAAMLLKADGRTLRGYATDPWYPNQPDGRFHAWPRAARSYLDNYKIAPPSADELARDKRHAPAAPTDWSWLYEAANHAWHACELMPDGDPRTAERLCIAGTWLKYADPQAADRFYKALVNRCGNTPLGREAEKLRWFPKLPQADATGR